MDQFKELMLAEKRVRLRNAWNEFVGSCTDELCKHTEFCYRDLIKEVTKRYYL